MGDYESLSHTKWECKYHVVFIPKYRRKVLYGELRQHLGDVFRKLALQKESRIEEPHAGSCLHDDRDPTEVRGFAGGRLYQGQECDPLSPDVRREEALIAAFRRLEQLGPRQRPQQPLRAAPSLKPPALP